MPARNGEVMDKLARQGTQREAEMGISRCRPWMHDSNGAGQRQAPGMLEDARAQILLQRPGAGMHVEG